MLKVLAACGAGMGSSQIIKMKIKKVLDKLKIESSIDHMSVGQAKSMVNNYDIIFVAEGLKNNFNVSIIEFAILDGRRYRYPPRAQSRPWLSGPGCVVGARSLDCHNARSGMRVPE